MREQDPPKHECVKIRKQCSENDAGTCNCLIVREVASAAAACSFIRRSTTRRSSNTWCTKNQLALNASKREPQMCEDMKACLHMCKLILFNFGSQLALKSTKREFLRQLPSGNIREVHIPATQRFQRVLSSIGLDAEVKMNCQQSMTTASYCWSVQNHWQPESEKGRMSGDGIRLQGALDYLLKLFLKSFHASQKTSIVKNKHILSQPS